MGSYLVLLVGEGPPLRSEPQLPGGEPVGVASQTGDRHGSREDRPHAAGDHQDPKPPAGPSGREPLGLEGSRTLLLLGGEGEHLGSGLITETREHLDSGLIM